MHKYTSKDMRMMSQKRENNMDFLKGTALLGVILLGVFLVVMYSSPFIEWVEATSMALLVAVGPLWTVFIGIAVVLVVWCLILTWPEYL